MIDSYIIKLIQNVVVVYEYENSSLTTLKNRGEKEQTYDEIKFWSWFKQKIEYKDEELSFVVVTDNEEFLIPDSSQIKLHQTSTLDNDSYINNEIISISDGLFVLSFPQRSTLCVESETTKEEAQEEEIPEEPLGENALAGYFRKQTQDFKNE